MSVAILACHLLQLTATLQTQIDELTTCAAAPSRSCVRDCEKEHVYMHLISRFFSRFDGYGRILSAGLTRPSAPQARDCSPQADFFGLFIFKNHILTLISEGFVTRDLSSEYLSAQTPAIHPVLRD